MNNNQKSSAYLIDVATGFIQKTEFKNNEECWNDLMSFINSDENGEPAQ